MFAELVCRAAQCDQNVVIIYQNGYEINII